MNLLDILTISRYYVYRKCIGATNKNWNFDPVVYKTELVELYTFRFSMTREVSGARVAYNASRKKES